MIGKSSNLPDIVIHVWDALVKGAQVKKNAFHYPSLGTSGAEGIQQRTVILRKVDRDSRLLSVYSDYRTGKISDMMQNERVNWLFYNHKTKEQVRAGGIAFIHHMDNEARQEWDQIVPNERGDYLGQVSPGTVTREQFPNIPAFLRNKKADYQNTEYGFNNFCLINCEIDSLEYLQVRRDGHIRAKLLFRNNAWQGMWIAP